MAPTNDVYGTIHTLAFTGPVLNSACPWASDEKDLKALYDSPYTGGVTTRTATMNGFAEDPSIHQHAFTPIASLNSYGYSPFPLAQYITWIRDLLSSTSSHKPIVISITSSEPDELGSMIQAIQTLRLELGGHQRTTSRIGIELNTSCPNIPSKPPPSYDPPALFPLLQVLARAASQDPTLTVGLKLPPYVIPAQFTGILDVIHLLEGEGEERNPISFLTCTNTLGGCISGAEEAGLEGEGWALPGGYGGMAGSALHALSLGNVHRFSTLLAEHPSPAMQKIAVIGVGGVSDAAGVRRMQRAGARIVECATALGREGVAVFEKMHA